tara:strand:+ start:165 stop:476 length:312 start_codon:yes stop_codon:yes gene_type:complete
MFKLIYFVPSTYLETTKDALFEIGCGTIGNYSHCSWETLGKGQFLPSKASDPFIGKCEDLTKVEEYRVEMQCPEDLILSAKETLLKIHPYETPAYEFIRLEDI